MKKTTQIAKREMTEVIEQLQNGVNPNGVSLVIDGDTLNFALQVPHQFTKIADYCRTVICCRSNPMTKALVVRTMKQFSGTITLSIGDGANDVAMLQEAHIGIGLFGKEGNQAAISGDYSLYTFSQLERLILVHGRYAKFRTSSFLQYHFYKNFTVFLVQLWYSIFNGYSAQTLHGSVVLTTFNAIMASLPPLYLGVIEKDIPEELCTKHPELYKEPQSGLYLNAKSFTYWAFLGIYQSLALFFIPYMVFYSYPSLLTPYGVATPDLPVWTQFFSGCGVAIVMLKFALITRYFTGLFVVAIGVSLFASVGLLAIEGGGLDELYGSFAIAYSSQLMYFVIVLTIVVATIPDIALNLFWEQQRPLVSKLYFWKYKKEQDHAKSLFVHK